MMDQAEKLRMVIDNLKNDLNANQVKLPVIQAKRSARVITVTSGKGGVGKTNISINLAVALSEKGLKVIVIDADFGLSNVDVLFGIIPKYSLVDVIKNSRSILDVLTDGPGKIRFISGGSGVEELIKLDKDKIKRFVANMELLDKFADIIIVDTGAGLSENVMSFIMAADDVLLVTTPEPTSITDAYALIKMVSNRDKNKNIKVIVNKADSMNEAVDVVNKLSLVAEKFLGVKLESAGNVLQDESVVKAVKLQKPFSISFPKSSATKSIKQIALKIMESEEKMNKQNGGISSFFTKLIGYIKA
jgi:flagellar biosynthesis protein FlhG